MDGQDDPWWRGDANADVDEVRRDDDWCILVTLVTGRGGVQRVTDHLLLGETAMFLDVLVSVAVDPGPWRLVQGGTRNTKISQVRKISVQ